MNQLSRYSFLVGALLLVGGAFFYYPKWQQPNTEATISWDVAGYYLYLPAIFIYGDLKQLSFGEKMLDQYHSAPELSAFAHPSGSRVIKYSCGQALQFMPWFLLAHASAEALGYPADGFSYPYQFALSMGSLLVALLGLWFLRQVLLRFFDDRTTAVVLLLIALGTNYLEYSAFHGALTHNWLFTVYTLLLYCTIRFYERPAYGWAAAIGVLVGWAALTRPTDLVAALLPLAWGIGSRQNLPERLTLWRNHWKKLSLAVVLAGAVGFIQLAYWKYTTGEWIVYSYQEQGFSWLRPHLADGLFSYRAGWLVYTPVMAFALAGFVLLAQRQARIFPAVLVFCLLYLYITFAWDIWWYGGSVGQRALVQSYPVLAFPLAAFAEWVFRQKKWIKWAAAGLAGLFLWYNLWLTHQAHKGGLFKAGDMTKAYFWKILGKSEVEEEAILLLDNKDAYGGERDKVQVLYKNDFEADTLHCPPPPIAGNNSAYVDEARQSTPVYEVPLPEAGTRWLRAGATFRAPQKEWDMWKMTQFVLRYSNGGKPVKENMIRVFRLLDNGQTRRITFDSKIPKKAFDKIQVFFWNANGAKTLLIDDLTVESFSEKEN